MTERVLGPVGTEVIFENDRVRVWHLRLAPGERSAVHRHDNDYVLVQVSGGRIAAEPEPDHAGEYNQYIEADVNPGDVVYVKRGGVETAVNKGDADYFEVIVELKD